VSRLARGAAQLASQPVPMETCGLRLLRRCGTKTCGRARRPPRAGRRVDAAASAVQGPASVARFLAAPASPLGDDGFRTVAPRAAVARLVPLTRGRLFSVIWV
jgi:hypothetical protein